MHKKYRLPNVFYFHNFNFQACDEAIEKLSLAANNPQASLFGVVNQILYPLVQGCESKDLKIIKVCYSITTPFFTTTYIPTTGT